jgi:hypothetical protein
MLLMMTRECLIYLLTYFILFGVKAFFSNLPPATIGGTIYI